MADDSLICATPLKKGPNKGLPATGTSAGGLRHWRAGEPPCDLCREAERVANHQRYWSNPEYWRAYNSEDQRRRYAKNPGPALAANRRWNSANPEARRVIDRRYSASVKGRAKRVRRRAYQTNALTIPFTSDQLTARLSVFGGRCYLRLKCDGVEADTIDHVIPLARGGINCLSNLRPACKPCNSAKGTRSLQQLGIS